MFDRLTLIAMASLLVEAAARLTEPTLEAATLRCLERFALDQLDVTRGRRLPHVSDVQPLTVLTSAELTTPAFEIQRDLVGALQRSMAFNMEVIEDGGRRSGEEAKTSFCLMVVDSMEGFERKLEILERSTAYDPSLLVLVYSAVGAPEEMLARLWARSLIHAAVLAPASPRRLAAHAMRPRPEPGRGCLEGARSVVLDTCTDGVFEEAGRNHYRNRMGSFNGCLVEVVANAIEPFVIDERRGFEMELLHEIGTALGVRFEVTMTGEDSWGEPGEDGSWSNGLGRVQNCSCLGVGNFYATPEHARDFRTTVPHFVSELVWVVPIAGFVPKWRVLTVIFGWHVWTACLGLMVVGAVSMRLTAEWGDELGAYRGWGEDFLVAFRMTIALAAARQPRGDRTRIVFVSLAVFSIVISSVYTSSLINCLTRPQREPQVDSIDDVLSAGYGIGGLPVYQDIFNVSEDETSAAIFEAFRVNDSLADWLEAVAERRDTCTIGADFFVHYMVAEGDPLVTDGDKRPKVHVIEKKIFSYPVTFVVSKRFPFLKKLNGVIQNMNTAGLVDAWTRKYLRKLERMEGAEDGGGFVQALTLDHLQGAFAILLLGYLLGAGALFLEVVVALVRLRLKRRKRRVRFRKNVAVNKKV